MLKWFLALKKKKNSQSELLKFFHKFPSMPTISNQITAKAYEQAKLRSKDKWDNLDF